MINLIPNINSEFWYTQYPSDTKTPDFKKTIMDGFECLEITLRDSYSVMGKWHCTVEGLKGDHIYNFEACYTTENTECDRTAVSVILTWMDEGGKYLTRDYADVLSEQKDNWYTLSRNISTPAGTAKVMVELHFRWASGGKVFWKEPVLIEEGPVAQRNVRVCTTIIKTFHNSMDKNLQSIVEILDKAAGQKADIVCLTEVPYTLDVKLPLSQKAESIPGKLTKVLSQKAVEHGFYIITSIEENYGGHYYNTAVLIDRKGNIAGKYRKTHLPLAEAEYGILAGNDYPVFDTDFGRIGMLICWDHNFPEPSRIMSLKGAEIIFLPTMSTFMIQCKARAVDNGIYFVVSGNYDEVPSIIINPVGEIIAQVTDEETGACTALIDLNQRYFKHWLSVGDADGEYKSLYIKERRPDTYKELI